MDDELRGWKAIADYLGTSDRTAQRWERDLGLPVRRGGGAKGTTVVATPQDLDQWRSSPVGVRAESERSADPAKPTPSQPAGDAPGEQEQGTSEGTDRMARALGGRAARGWLVAGAVTAVVAVAAAGAWLLRDSPRQKVAVAGTGAVAARPAAAAGIGSVVVLKLTAASGETWSLRVKNGAMASWEGGGPTLGIVAAVDGALVRLILSQTERSNSGGERRAALGDIAIPQGTAAPIRFAGGQMSIEWTGTEGPPLATGGGSTVAPPRCCVACGGVTVCATEVAGWCGSCCDPRFTSCRPPR
jgi:hypothetical protein